MEKKYVLTHICDEENQVPVICNTEEEAFTELKKKAAEIARANLDNEFVCEEDLPKTDGDIYDYLIRTGHFVEESRYKLRCFDMEVLEIFPVEVKEQEMEEVKVAAEFYLGLLDMGITEEISLEDARKEIEGALEDIRGKGELLDYLIEAAYEYTDKDKDVKENSFALCEEPKIEGATDYGTPYSLIARFILGLQGTRIFNYDDQTHYKIIEDGLKNYASKELLYYLSRGVENIIQRTR